MSVMPRNSPTRARVLELAQGLPAPRAGAAVPALRPASVSEERFVRACQTHGRELAERGDGLLCPQSRHVVYQWDVVDRQKRRAVVAVNARGDLAGPASTVAPIPALRPAVRARLADSAVGLPAFLPLLPTVSEAAIYLGVGRGAVERLIHERALHVDRREFVTWPRSERNVPRVPFADLRKHRSVLHGPRQTRRV